jgi:vacuolar-type H+-ATPase catalytic subunit A/Vma1
MISLEKSNYIRTLADEHGYIEPSRVVEVARDPGNPLHDEFEWDIQRAAEEQWIEQARRLIRLVRVEITVEHREIRAVGYVVDPDRPPKSHRYVDLTMVALDRNRAQQIIIDEMSRITAAVRRAQAIATVLGLEDELDRLLDNVRAVIAAAEQAEAKMKRKKAKTASPPKTRAKGRRAPAVAAAAAR